MGEQIFANPKLADEFPFWVIDATQPTAKNSAGMVRFYYVPVKVRRIGAALYTNEHEIFRSKAFVVRSILPPRGAELVGIFFPNAVTDKLKLLTWLQTNYEGLDTIKKILNIYFYEPLDELLRRAARVGQIDQELEDISSRVPKMLPSTTEPPAPTTVTPIKYPKILIRPKDVANIPEETLKKIREETFKQHVSYHYQDVWD